MIPPNEGSNPSIHPACLSLGARKYNSRGVWEIAEHYRSSPRFSPKPKKDVAKMSVGLIKLCLPGSDRRRKLQIKVS